jgi:hypothetical protein
MKGKVLAILKPLLASKGFSKDELEGLAEITAKNLTEASTDEEINNAVSGVVPYAELMQKVGNRMVSSVENKYRGWIDPKTIEPNPQPIEPKPEPKGITPEDIQKMIAEGIEAGLRPYREKEEKQRLQTLLYSHEKVKSVPEMFRSKYSIEKEEDLETVAAQVENDFTALKQSLVTSGEFVTPPQSGNGAGEVDDLIGKLQAMGAKGN